MRASPACQVLLQRFGVWRGAVLLVASAGLASTVAWWVSREPRPSWLWLGAAAALVVALASSLWRMPPRQLHWDGQVWRLGESAGNLVVAIDLGSWMLLRFVPDGRRRAQWLPVQRRGLEAQWHALRCAVYSPRPASDP